MRILLTVVLLFVFALSGCARKAIADKPVTAQPRAGSAAGPTSATVTNQTLMGTPDSLLGGKVVHVNTAGRFVVLNFPPGRMAAIEQRLNLYRGGVKVGEVKVTGPARETNIVADLVAGEAEVGDDTRSQ